MKAGASSEPGTLEFSWSRNGPESAYEFVIWERYVSKEAFVVCVFLLLPYSLWHPGLTADRLVCLSSWYVSFGRGCGRVTYGRHTSSDLFKEFKAADILAKVSIRVTYHLIARGAFR